MWLFNALRHLRRLTMGRRLRTALQRNRDASTRLDRVVKEMIDR